MNVDWTFHVNHYANCEISSIHVMRNEYAKKTMTFRYDVFYC